MVKLKLFITQIKPIFSKQQIIYRIDKLKPNILFFETYLGVVLQTSKLDYLCVDPAQPAWPRLQS